LVLSGGNGFAESLADYYRKQRNIVEEIQDIFGMGDLDYKVVLK